MFPEHVPLLVVGAGPTGLLLANLLAASGVPVLVVERNHATVDHPRAIVLDDEGMRALQTVGLADEVLRRSLPGEGAHFFDDDGVLFAETGSGEPIYGHARRYFIHQPDLERVLASGLGRWPHASLRFGATLTAIETDEMRATATIESGGATHMVTADHVFACDGGRSFVREALGIAMEGSTYPDDWLIIDTLNDPDADPRSKAFCRLDRPHLSIPAPRDGRRYEFKLRPGEDVQEAIRFEHIRSLLLPFRTIRPEDVARVAVYSFHARIAERLGAGRIWLLGDAAHLTPPFAGQGMNAGLRDAVNVAWKAALVVRGLARPELLETFERERRGPIAAMIQLAVTMGEIVMPQSEADRGLRVALMAKLAPYPAVRDYLIGMRFKPAPRYDDGVFVGLRTPSVPASLVGAAIPQPAVTRDGRRELLDDLLGPGFALIAQSPELNGWLVRAGAGVLPELSPALVRLSWPGGCEADGAAAIADLATAFPLKAHRDQILLVRPDRFIAAAFRPEEARITAAAFRQALFAAG